MLPEPVAVTLRVIKVLEEFGIPYFIAGSLARAVHGVVRATADTGLVASLHPEHAYRLANALRDAFYVDAEAVYDAIRRRSSFNVIHLETMFKVDIFIPKQRPFDRAQFERRREHVIATAPERTAYVASAEDTVLAKLEWYGLGAEVSERQWRDVVGVLEAQGVQLDLAYLRQWASELGIASLLEAALNQVGTLVSGS